MCKNSVFNKVVEGTFAYTYVHTMRAYRTFQIRCNKKWWQEGFWFCVSKFCTHSRLGVEGAPD